MPQAWGPAGETEEEQPRQMTVLEPCLPVPSEAYPLIREGREAGAGSAVEWEGDSWGCVWVRKVIVPGGENPGSIASGGEMGGVLVCGGGYFG